MIWYAQTVEARVATIIRMTRQEKTAREIAEYFGVTRAHITRFSSNMGLRLYVRPRVGKKDEPRIIERVAELAGTGMSRKVIAQELGITRAMVNRICSDNSIRTIAAPGRSRSGKVRIAPLDIWEMDEDERRILFAQRAAKAAKATREGANVL